MTLWIGDTLWTKPLKKKTVNKLVKHYSAITSNNPHLLP